MKAEQRVGKKYGGLRVNGFTMVGEGRKRHAIFHCTCLRCGGPSDQALGNLFRVKSCGCVREARSANAVAYWPEYAVWEQMIQRCYNKKHARYEDYGKRGITVHDGWRAVEGRRKADAFRAFIKYVGRRPDRPGDGRRWSIEREDNDGNYEPGNVHWALPSEQSRNQRRNRLLRYMGKVWTITDLAKANGISPPQLHKRLAQGWSVKKAVETPTAMRGRKVWAAKAAKQVRARRMGRR